jgi:glycosyltransferase 2 family protein
MCLLIALSLGFVGWQIKQGWPQLAAHQWDISLPTALLSFVLLLLNFVLVSWAWAIIFRDLEPNTKVSTAKTFSIIYSAQLGRYIPGKIWLVLGQVYLADRYGFRKSSAVIAGIVQILCGTCAAFVIIAATALLAGRPIWMTGVAAAIALAGIGALFVAPGWLESFINRFRARKDQEPIRLAISRAAMAKVLLVMTLAWAEHCLAFDLLAASIVRIDLLTAADLAFSYAVAYNIAFFILIVPGGLGVREGALTSLAGPILGTGIAGMLAILQRLWIILAELLAFGIAIAIYRRSQKK